MSTFREGRSPPRERTFAEVFPWRNIRRAVMLLLLIVLIVAVKRSAEPLLARVGQLWGTAAPSAPATGTQTTQTMSGRSDVRTIRLGPGLAPATPPPSRSEQPRP